MWKLGDLDKGHTWKANSIATVSKSFFPLKTGPTDKDETKHGLILSILRHHKAAWFPSGKNQPKKLDLGQTGMTKTPEALKNERCLKASTLFFTGGKQ